MTDYAAITDPTNPFATTGLSDEVEAILEYLACGKRAGLDVVATSTTDHPMYTTSGNVSRHRMAGTNGAGLAVDCRMRTRGNDIHRAVFDMFVLVEAQCHELIYAGAPYNIKAGKRVQPYAVSSHHDHVHVAVTKGTFLRWPGRTPEEATMAFALDGTTPVPNSPPNAQNLWPFWGWRKDGSVFAFNGAPGPIPTASDKATITEHGPVIALHPRTDGVLGYYLISGVPGEGATWSTYTFSP